MPRLPAAPAGLATSGRLQHAQEARLGLGRLTALVQQDAVAEQQLRVVGAVAQAIPCHGRRLT